MTSETFHYVRKVGGPGKEGLKMGMYFVKGKTWFCPKAGYS